MPSDATAFPHRHPGYSLLLLSQWRDAADTAPNVAWTRETHAAMAPYARPERYANFMDADDAWAVDEAYGPNVARLARLKATYDPTNLFRPGSTVQPVA